MFKFHCSVSNKRLILARHKILTKKKNLYMYNECIHSKPRRKQKQNYQVLCRYYRRLSESHTLRGTDEGRSDYSEPRSLLNLQ